MKVPEVVDALSKIENLKAIHNSRTGRRRRTIVVDALSKIENLKAIHNFYFGHITLSFVVDALSKIENLKAIHNMKKIAKEIYSLLMLYRR